MRFPESHDESAPGPTTVKGVDNNYKKFQMIGVKMTKNGEFRVPLYPKLEAPRQYHESPIF